MAKRYHSLADDINALQFELMENPETGVSLGGGKRKIRLGVKSKGGGKRGGLRVITLNVVIETNDTCVNLLTIYDKKEIPNVSDNSYHLIAFTISFSNWSISLMGQRTDP